jgi:hypothetical protein
MLMKSSQREEDFENICNKCGRKNTEHPSTGRFGTIVLFGHECAWNPDDEFRHFVMETLKGSGYDLQEFGYESLKPKS